MPKKPNRIGIIGVGNPLMGDDGVGIAVVELLRGESLPENVSIIDIGTGGTSLLHALAKLDAAIIVDAVDFGGAHGETRCFSPEEIESIKCVSGLSTHESDLLKIIKLSKELDECPETVMIFAIQPADMAPSTGLSISLQRVLSKFVKDVREICKKV